MIYNALLYLKSRQLYVSLDGYLLHLDNRLMSLYPNSCRAHQVDCINRCRGILVRVCICLQAVFDPEEMRNKPIPRGVISTLLFYNH